MTSYQRVLKSLWAALEPDQLAYVVADAHYWYFANYHGGQWSAEYQKLSILSQCFRPAINANGPDSDCSRELYRALEERER